MAEVIALRGTWAGDYALATPGLSSTAGLATLPREWTVADRVVVDGRTVDHVVVGPNGVFTILIDPDPRPVTLGDDGIYRGSDRVTTAVKDALLAAHMLRRQAQGRLFAYPILIAPVDATPVRLDRLGVIPGDRIAEFIWSHPGLPLRRSQRQEILWSLKRPNR
jgi:hypothetical protein